ncbi:MAG: single-stranded-DNA-specific exonuclease RecJ [Omnitrophica WOR_2 bacterium RBG_13_41_10]|nr:MAG: single-stranded-DNA-specific exonuclease RecJ [Omnitrophica WOR_2 bacterium RBG_13_41_10]
MPTSKILKIAPPNLKLQNTFSEKLKVSCIFAQILINRGIDNIGDAGKFLETKLQDLLDPHLFSDIDKATGLVKKAARNKKKIMVFGDYDVDGITSLALMKNTLDEIGASVITYLPHRIKEGYGLNKDILQLVRHKKADLLITVDCGTNSLSQIQELRQHNIEVIVTDHHEPLDNEVALCASAIINPKLKTSGYKYRDLAGVGVAYKFCQAIKNENLFDDLDLVALGTVSDVVPLTGENRIMVKEGLSRIASTKRIGLKALIETSGIKNKEIKPSSVSFILGPRINASGRMDTAEIAFKLLISEEEQEAQELARLMETHNRTRQKIENKILEQAQDLINKQVNFKEHKVIVVAGEDWHQGVLGVVASKLADRFYRPTIVISKKGDLCKGSGRSIKSFHLFNSLLECQELLDTFGGHSHAVGLIIRRSNIESFKNKINDLARGKMLFEDLVPTLDIDMELALSDLSASLVMELEKMEPFGEGNPEPLFYTKGLKLKGQPQALSRDTLKFWVSDGNTTYQAIGFGMASFKESLIAADSFDLVYTPRMDNWQGNSSMILEIRDIFFRV